MTKLCTAAESWISEVNHIRHSLDCSSLVQQQDRDLLFSFTALSQREGTYFLLSKVGGFSASWSAKVSTNSITKQPLETFIVAILKEIMNYNHKYRAKLPKLKTEASSAKACVTVDTDR